jgi:hypothetical protein
MEVERAAELAQPGAEAERVARADAGAAELAARPGAEADRAAELAAQPGAEAERAASPDGGGLEIQRQGRASGGAARI